MTGIVRRRRATAAATLGVVVSVALAGCAVPGAGAERSAGPPAAAPSAPPAVPGTRGPTGTAPPGTAPPGTPARTVPPERTPTTPADGLAPARPPSPDTAAASPGGAPTGPPRTAPASVSPGPTDGPARPSPEPTPEASATTGSETSGGRGGDGSTTLHIGSWSARVVRGGQDAVDACRDAVQWAGPDLGTEDGYALRTAVVVGHDHCGFARFARLPVGTIVSATTPRGTLRYRVYATYVSPGRGTPSHGLYWGDLTLQSCVGPDTGFSYLMRV
ncbi:hypothetical protein [Streptomyces sp. NPDC059894]|uniref:hypothetical protein n=1 Tax=unclassified Streptomyces TaxID=2593676 RepID=UPI0036636340